MLHRYDDNGLVVISQPSHAWISGQLASSWGNNDSDLATAGPELRIAAEQHDIAWLNWEANPTLNPETGLPYAFSELPTLEHLAIWANATSHALAYGRLPALLISMHGTYLYERFHDFDSDTTEEVRAARRFLATEEEFQGRTIGELERSRDISRRSIHYQRRLVSLWDAMSLGLCMGIEDAREFGNVPASGNDLTLTIRTVGDSKDRFTVDPWPFSRDHVGLFCEGRRLEGTFEDIDDMRRAIGCAPSEMLEFTLVASA